MDDDTVITTDGFTFCINKNLLEQITGVNIDLSYMGFLVEPETPLAAANSSACGSCGSGSSCSI
jgi:Fe-S cluster assembly iron-binding protein IscA